MKNMFFENGKIVILIKVGKLNMKSNRSDNLCFVLTYFIAQY